MPVSAKSAIYELITAYLLAPSADRPAIADKLANLSEESFALVIDYSGPYPESLHGRDVIDDHSVDLLADLLRRKPELFLGCDLTKLSAMNRYRLTNAAGLTGDPAFTDQLVGLLRDRSIPVKMTVVHWILHNEHLRVQKTLHELKRLLQIPSIANSDYDRRQVERAINQIEVKR